MEVIGRAGQRGANFADPSGFVAHRSPAAPGKG